MSAASTITAKRNRVYRCDICGMALRNERWVYSATRGVRYCHPTAWSACESRSLKQKAGKR